MEKKRLENKNLLGTKSAEAELRIKSSDGSNFVGHVNAKTDEAQTLSIHLDLTDPITGTQLKCDVNPENPEGVGDPDACVMLRDAVSKTKQALKDR